MKILHCADLHIREKDIDEIGACLTAIVSTAQSEQPDLAVIAGDVFDSRDVKIDSQAARAAIGFISALADICPVAIVIGTPSHDGAAPRIMQYVRGAFPVIVAERPMQVFLYESGFCTGDMQDGRPQAVITLIPQPTKQYWQTQSGVAGSDQEIGQALSGVFAGFGTQAAEYPGVPHVLVYHGGISGAKMSTGQTLLGNDIEVSLEQLDLARADLNLIGHLHLPQRLGKNTFYSGSVYMNNWGEDHKHGFYIHDTGTKESRFVETPCKRAVRFAFDMTVGEKITIPFEGIGGATVRIDVTCWQDQAGEVGKETITENLTRWGAESVDVRIIRIPRETVRAQSVLAAETLRDKLSRMAEIKGEQVPESILQKADELETMPADELINRLTT